MGASLLAVAKSIYYFQCQVIILLNLCTSSKLSFWRVSSEVMDELRTKGGARVRGSFAIHSLVLLQLTLLAVQKGELPGMLPNLYLTWVVTTKRNNCQLSSIATSYIISINIFTLVLNCPVLESFSFSMAHFTWFFNEIQKLHVQCTLKI